MAHNMQLGVGWRGPQHFVCLWASDFAFSSLLPPAQRLTEEDLSKSSQILSERGRSKDMSLLISQIHIWSWWPSSSGSERERQTQRGVEGAVNELGEMRVLQLGLSLALTSGIVALLIYITGVSYLRNLFSSPLLSFPCPVSGPSMGRSASSFAEFLLISFRADQSARLSDEDFEALQSLQSGFQKCVVSSSRL